MGLALSCRWPELSLCTFYLEATTVNRTHFTVVASYHNLWEKARGLRDK